MALSKKDILALIAHERTCGTYVQIKNIPKQKYDWNVSNTEGYRGRFPSLTPTGLATQIYGQGISMLGIDIVFSEPKPKSKNALVRNLLLSGVEAGDI